MFPPTPTLSREEGGWGGGGRRTFSVAGFVTSTYCCSGRRCDDLLRPTLLPRGRGSGWGEHHRLRRPRGPRGSFRHGRAQGRARAQARPPSSSSSRTSRSSAARIVRTHASMLALWPPTDAPRPRPRATKAKPAANAGISRWCATARVSSATRAAARRAAARAPSLNNGKGRSVTRSPLFLPARHNCGNTDFLPACPTIATTIGGRKPSRHELRVTGLFFHPGRTVCDPDRATQHATVRRRSQDTQRRLDALRPARVRGDVRARTRHSGPGRDRPWPSHSSGGVAGRGRRRCRAPAGRHDRGARGRGCRR